MTVKSRKAKGRRFQQIVRDKFLSLDPGGLYESTVMGEPGSDIKDPLTRLPWDYTECKNHESWPSLDDVADMMHRKKHDGTWVAIYGRNHCREPLVVLPFSTLGLMLVAWFKELDNED